MIARVLFLLSFWLDRMPPRRLWAVRLCKACRMQRYSRASSSRPRFRIVLAGIMGVTDLASRLWGISLTRGLSARERGGATGDRRCRRALQALVPTTTLFACGHTADTTRTICVNLAIPAGPHIATKFHGAMFEHRWSHTAIYILKCNLRSWRALTERCWVVRYAQQNPQDL